MLNTLSHPFVLWFLSSIVIGFLTFGYTSWREVGAMKWSNWNVKRLLNVELSYRLGGAVYTFSKKQKPQDTNIGEILGKILDNREDNERVNFIIPRLRERSYASLHWDLIQRYKRNHPDRKILESALQINYELRFAQKFDEDLLNRAKEVNKGIQVVWEDILKDRPPKYLIPRWSDLESQMH